MYYINCDHWIVKENGDIIKAKRSMTVEEHEVWRRAKEALDVYSYYDPMGNYWISTRACKNWTENHE